MADATVDRITTTCSSCNVKIRVPSTAVGSRAKCPKCGEKFVIQDLVSPKPATKPTPAKAETIRVDCPDCGAKFRAPKRAEGRKIKCAKCQGVIGVPDPNAPAVDDGLGFSDDGNDLFAALGSGSAVSGDATTDAMTACPGCGAAMSVSAVTCDSCGFSRRSGGLSRQTSYKKSSGSAKVLGAVGSAAGGMAILGGRFVLGCVGSAVGAGIGAVIWFLIIKYAGREVGYVAWGIGILSGVGMCVGSGRPNLLGGVIAAGMSIAAIVVAKYCAFVQLAESLGYDPETLPFMQFAFGGMDILFGILAIASAFKVGSMGAAGDD